MKLLLLIAFTLAFCYASSGQNPEKVRLLEKRIAEARDDAKKITALNALAEYYSIYKLDKKADSLLYEQVSIAEFSRDKKLLLQAFFNPAIVTIGSWTTNATFDRIIKFLEKGLQYAEDDNPDYTTLAYIRLAAVYRKRGQLVEARNKIRLAYSNINSRKPVDSILAQLYVEDGNIYISESDALNAYKNYSRALDISYEINNIPLRSEIHHHLANLYMVLNDSVSEVKQINKSRSLNEKNDNKPGLFNDLIALAKCSEDKKYIDSALALAVLLQSDKMRMEAKNVMFSWYSNKLKNSSLTRKYLDSDSDLTQYFMNMGIENFYWTIGNIYKYSEPPQLDSALHYFKLSEVKLESSFTDFNRIDIFESLGETYLDNGDSALAKDYYEKAYNLAKQNGIQASIPFFTEILSALYAHEGDYLRAYTLHVEALQYVTEAEQKNAKDKLALIDVENEAKAKEHDAERQSNFHLIIITIVISLIFLLFILFGMFPVTELTLKIFGYLAFISLFEFFVLLIDKYLHDTRHLSTLWVWLIKVGLIACMVPIQHGLEHKLVNYLSSRKLLIKRQFWLKKIILSIKNISRGKPRLKRK